MGEMHRVLQLHSTDQPEVHEIAADMRAIADSYGAEGASERVLIGEIYLPVDRLMHYYGQERAGCTCRSTSSSLMRRGEARALATLIADYEAALPPGGWPNWVLGNHDRPRVATKRGTGAGPRGGDAAADAARHAHALLRRRTGLEPTSRSRRPWSRIRANCASLGSVLGRDPVRTPMPWDGSEMPASRRPRHGCRSMPTGRRATSRGWQKSRIQF